MYLPNEITDLYKDATKDQLILINSIMTSYDTFSFKQFEKSLAISLANSCVETIVGKITEIQKMPEYKTVKYYEQSNRHGANCYYMTMKFNPDIPGFKMTPKSQREFDNIKDHKYLEFVYRSDLRYRSIYVNGYFYEKDGEIYVDGLRAYFKSQHINDIKILKRGYILEQSTVIIYPEYRTFENMESLLSIECLAKALNEVKVDKPKPKSKKMTDLILCDGDNFRFLKNGIVSNSIFCKGGEVRGIVTIVGKNKIHEDITEGEPYFLINTHIIYENFYTKVTNVSIITKDGESFYPLTNHKDNFYVNKGICFKDITKASKQDALFLKQIIENYKL